MKVYFALAIFILASSTLCAQEWMPIPLNNTPHSLSHSAPVGAGFEPGNIFASVGDTTFIVANGGRVGEELFFLKDNAIPQLHTDFLRFKEKDDLLAEVAGLEASSFPQINKCSDHIMGIAATKLLINDDNSSSYEYKIFQIDENNPQGTVTPLFEDGTVVTFVSKAYGDASYAIFKVSDVSPNFFIYNCKTRLFSKFHIDANEYHFEAVNSRFYFYRRLDEATGAYFQSAFDFIDKKHYSIPWDVDGVNMQSLSLSVVHDKGILYIARTPAPNYGRVYLFWSPENERFEKIDFTKDDNIESSIRNLVESLRSIVNIAVNSAEANGVINCQISAETGCFFFDLDNYHITKVAALEDMEGVTSSRIKCASKKPLEPDTYCSISPLNSESEIVKLNFDTQAKKLHVDLIGKVAFQPLFLTNIRDKLYWFEEDEIIGKELVEADLSNVEDRTRYDLNATNYAAEPKHFKKFGTELFFTANKGAPPAQASKGTLEKYPTDVEIFSIDKNHRVRQVSNFHEKFYDIKHVDHSAKSLLVTVPLIMSDASFADTVYRLSKASGESNKLLSLNDIRQTVEKIYLHNSNTAYAVMKETVYAEDDLYYLITLDLVENKEVARRLILEANQTAQFRFFSDKLFWILSYGQGIEGMDLTTGVMEQHDLGAVAFIEERGEQIDEFYVQKLDSGTRRLMFYSKEHQRFVSTNMQDVMGIKRNGEDYIFYGGYFAYIFRLDKTYTVIFEHDMFVNCITTIGDKLVVWGTHGRFSLETNSIEVHDLKTQSVDVYPTYDKQMYNCSASDQSVYGNIREIKSGNGPLSFQDDIAAVKIPGIGTRKLLDSFALEGQNSLEQYFIESQGNGVVELGKLNAVSGESTNIWRFRNEFLNPAPIKLNESTLGVFGMVNGFDAEAARFQLQTYNVTNGVTKRFNWPGNWQDARIIAVPDVDGDGLNEPTLVGRYIPADNRPQAVILSSINGKQLNRISFPPNFSFHQYIPMEDHNFDGAGDIAFLGELERNGKTQVKVESVAYNQRLLNLNFPSKWIAKEIVKIQDINRDGYQDIALLAQNSENANLQIVVKSGTKGNPFTKVFSWPAKLEQGEFHSIPDLNADGIDEVSIFGIDSNAQRLRLVVKDGAKSNVNLGSIGWPAEYQDYSLFVLKASSERTLAALISRVDDDKWRLDVKNMKNQSIYKRETSKHFSSIHSVTWVHSDAQNGFSILGVGEYGGLVQEFINAQ
tara:strand:- start:621 stop:4295 length:3675 start_codon:yes stop_codon:yes gene_type:complete